MKRLIIYSVLFMVALSFVACFGPNGRSAAGNDGQASSSCGIYYWKTVFSLNPWERDFLTRHHIDTLYLRLFDIGFNPDRDAPEPIATIHFADSIPDGLTVVPVVYITTSGLINLNDHAHDVYRRIQAMAQRHGFADRMPEIQLDCDWTSDNQRYFFGFCQRMVAMARADGLRISATIRLHQLRMDPPPVDRGVLMLYNTGSLYDPDTQNSILSRSDVKPYLSRSIDYPLALTAAYPTYSWAILIRDNRFAGILHQCDFSDTALYAPSSANVYEVKTPHTLETRHLQAGDRIRVEHSLIDEILTVKGYVESSLGGPMPCIIYHLDSLNLSGYTDSEIQSILQ